MRADLGVPLQSGGPVIQTVHTVHVKETVKVDDHRHEETDFHYTKERISYINLIRNLGFLAIIVAIASIVLASIHVASVPLDFAIILLVAACIFFIGAILAVYWAIKAAKSFKAHGDLFQPQLNEGLSRTVFIAGLLLAGIAAFVITHLYVEYEYSPDFTKAQTTSTNTWDNAFSGRTEDGLNSYLRKHFIIQSAFVGFFFFFFLLAARAAFNCLKFGNQAMSQLVFLGNFLLLGLALCVIFFADNAFEYAAFPKLRDAFPVWNIRGLYFVAVALCAVAVTGFLVDHKSWRVGFFVLAFLLLVFMVLLASFTGYAYRNTRHAYQYYKGIPQPNTCIERMSLVHSTELEAYGCPSKYVAADTCDRAQWVNKWEFTTADPIQPGTTDNNAQGYNAPTYCLNTKCCGVQGQLYSKHLIQLAAFGLLTTLAAALVSIGCYYFWYVTWVDTARDKRRDFIWLGLMGLTVLVFIILFFALDRSYINEKTGTGARQLEEIIGGW